MENSNNIIIYETIDTSINITHIQTCGRIIILLHLEFTFINNIIHFYNNIVYI